MRAPLFIGIAGGTGSGKSTFAERIAEMFGNDVSVIAYDNYYKPQDHIPMSERVKTNYDHPSALDTELLVSHLKSLAEGRAVEIPVYDFRIHTRTDSTVTVVPTHVIIVDGILTFHDETLRNIFDIRIFVDADADERILRRLTRDVRERGRDIDGVVEQYLTTVKPMHGVFVEPTKKYADIIINGGKNKIALDVVASRIKKRIDELC